MAALPMLQTLHLSFSGCPNLSRVDSLGPCLTGTHISHLELHFGRCTGLASCSLFSEGAAPLLPKLTYLSLRFSRCSGLTDIVPLKTFLCACPKLEHLRLSCYDGGRIEHLDPLAEGLSLLSQLKLLDLDFSFCSGIATVEPLFRVLSGAQGLELLHLSLKGCSHLPEALQDEFHSPLEFCTAFQEGARSSVAGMVPFKSVLKELVFRTPLKH